jgi:hypothetical protein
VLHSKNMSTEIEIVCRRQEGREGEGYYEPLSNNQIFALPTPLTEPRQVAVVHLPHPLSAPSCEVCPTFSESRRLCDEGRQSTVHITYSSSGNADAEDNCSGKYCSRDDRNVSTADISEDHTVGYDDGRSTKSVLSVTATGRSAGYERKGYSDTTGTRKPQSIHLDERQISSQLFL